MHVNPAISNHNQHTHYVRSFNNGNVNDKLIIAGKITVMALTTLSLFAAACFLGHMALPFIAAEGGLASMGAIAAVGGAAGGAIGSTVSPRILEEDNMFKSTDHNLMDCVTYIGKSVAVTAGGAVIGGLITVAGIVGLIALAILGSIAKENPGFVIGLAITS